MPLAALFLAGVATRAPFVGTYLANWDSVQYALGLTEFDVVRHQPHPPGSILYVALGRLALAITGEANLALAWISLLACAASIVLCYVVGRELFGARIALAGTVLFFASPLTWYYGAVAL
ncbi:MAG: glycosyl transferase, partial [Chloroflexota bacterium]